MVHVEKFSQSAKVKGGKVLKFPVNLEESEESAF